jgi:hypothetical protein
LFDLYSDSYHAFVGAAARLGAMLDTANEGLVYFNVARQWFAFSSHHCYSKSLQDRPSHSIPRAQSTFERFCRQTVLGGGYVPRRFKPCCQSFQQ